MSPGPESDGVSMVDAPIASVLPRGLAKIIGFGEIGHMLISEIEQHYPNTFKDAQLVKYEPPHISETGPDVVVPEEEEVKEEVLTEKGSISRKITHIFANIASRIGQSPEQSDEERERNTLAKGSSEVLRDEDALTSISEKERRRQFFREHFRNLLADSNIIYTVASFEDVQDISDCLELLSYVKELDILAFTIILLPQSFPNIRDVYDANRKLQKIRLLVDLVVVTPNLHKISPAYIALLLRGIDQLIDKTGLVNLDVADIRAIVHGGKVAVIGFGQGSGEDRAFKAIKRAIRSKLLPLEPHGSDRALVNVSGGPDMTVLEAEKVSEEVRKIIKPESRIIWGAMVDPTLEDKIKVTLVIGVTPMQVLMGVYIE